MPKGKGYKVYDSDEAKLKAYRRRVMRAEAEFDSWKDEAERLIEMYALEPRTEEFTPSGHRITTGVGVGNIDAMFSSLTAVEVDVVVKNEGLGDRQLARTTEAGIRQVWRENEVSDVKGPKAIKDFLLGAGVGWVKVDYEYAEEVVEVARSEEELKPEIDALISGALEAGQPPPSPDTIAELVPATRFETQVTRDRIVVDYVPWDEVWWDDSAREYEDARWMIQVSHLTPHEIKSNEAWREYVRQNHGRKGLKAFDDIKPDSEVKRAKRLPNLVKGSKPTEDEELVTVFEMWDFETGTVCVFPRNADIFFEERPNPFALHDDIHDKNPFVLVNLRRVSGRVRGLSDMGVMKPGIEELTEYRSNLATYVARTIPKIMGPARAMTEAGRKALSSREWGAFIELEDGVAAADIVPLQPPQLPQQVFDVPGVVTQGIRESTGASELMRGLFPDRKRTATETVEVANATTVRQAEKRNALAKFYENIARRILVLMQQFYDAPRLERYTEADGDVVWEWTAEDIVEEAKLEIHLSPKEAVTEQTRMDKAMMVFQSLASIPNVDIVELARYVMEEFGLDPQVISNILKTQEEVQQDQMSQLQLEAEQQAVGQGEAPAPENVPGPLAGAELSAAVNPGEVPPAQAAVQEEPLPLEEA